MAFIIIHDFHSKFSNTKEDPIIIEDEEEKFFGPLGSLRCTKNLGGCICNDCWHTNKPGYDNRDDGVSEASGYNSDPSVTNESDVECGYSDEEDDASDEETRSELGERLADYLNNKAKEFYGSSDSEDEDRCSDCGDHVDDCECCKGECTCGQDCFGDEEFFSTHATSTDNVVALQYNSEEEQEEDDDSDVDSLADLIKYDSEDEEECDTRPTDNVTSNKRKRIVYDSDSDDVCPKRGKPYYDSDDSDYESQSATDRATLSYYVPRDSM